MKGERLLAILAVNKLQISTSCNFTSNTNPVQRVLFDSIGKNGI